MAEFTPKPGVPEGQRFTNVYREKGEPTPDSQRMRYRIARLISEHETKDFDRFAEGEIGLPTTFSKAAFWPALLKDWPIDDVLNLVTVFIRHRSEKATSDIARAHLTETLVQKSNRIFEEQNVPYRVDTQGGVHYFHDAEFVRNAQATIAGLSRQRYANSLHSFEAGQKAITSASPDGKTGIRNVFAAAEGLFRLLVKAPRLTTDFASALDPLLQKRYAGNAIALGASAKLLASFKDWIEACHFYRHEEGKPDNIAQPPIELAIHLMSSGAPFIRLLVELDEGSQL